MDAPLLCLWIWPTEDKTPDYRHGTRTPTEGKVLIHCTLNSQNRDKTHGYFLHVCVYLSAFKTWITKSTNSYDQWASVFTSVKTWARETPHWSTLHISVIHIPRYSTNQPIQSGCHTWWRGFHMCSYKPSEKFCQDSAPWMTNTSRDSLISVVLGTSHSGKLICIWMWNCTWNLPNLDKNRTDCNSFSVHLMIINKNMNIIRIYTATIHVLYLHVFSA